MERHTDIWRDRQTDRQIHGETHRYMERQTDRQTDTWRDTQIYGETDRQTDRYMGRQTDNMDYKPTSTHLGARASAEVHSPRSTMIEQYFVKSPNRA